MARHSASGLEDVFYKLCTNQKRESKQLTRQAFMMQHSMALEDEHVSERDKIAYEYPAHTTKWSRWTGRCGALCRKYLIQTMRQPESVIGQFILPIICLIMFCICIGGTPSHLPVAVINEENPPFLSEILLKHMNSYIL